MVEVTRRVVGSREPPSGFIRREVSVGGTHAAAYATVGTREGGDPATVVVVVTPTGPALVDRRVIQKRFGLTQRETEVALMLAARKSNKEIAAQLSIAQKTAWRHTAQVLSKLNAGSRLAVRGVLESVDCHVW